MKSRDENNYLQYFVNACERSFYCRNKNHNFYNTGVFIIHICHKFKKLHVRRLSMKLDIIGILNY